MLQVVQLRGGQRVVEDPRLVRGPDVQSPGDVQHLLAQVTFFDFQLRSTEVKANHLSTSLPVAYVHMLSCRHDRLHACLPAHLCSNASASLSWRLRACHGCAGRLQCDCTDVQRASCWWCCSGTGFTHRAGLAAQLLPQLIRAPQQRHIPGGRKHDCSVQRMSSCS